MCATKNSNRRTVGNRSLSGECLAWTSGRKAAKTAARVAAVPCRFGLLAILCVLFLSHDFWGPMSVFGAAFEVNPVAEITINSEGEPLRFPTFVFYDGKFDETYIVDGAKQWVVVYASDFFPLATFASGRGIIRPFGGFANANGMIYLCQGADENKPSRITVLNGAFIIVREISLDNIPNVQDFRPWQVVVSREGLMYVSGQNFRGVAVLDSDGNFLRWLRPLDETYLSPAQIAALEGKAAENEEGAEGGDSPEASSEQPTNEGLTADIPEQYRPKTKKEKEEESGPHIGPVVIRSVNIDKAGRLYLLSDETSKTYVYKPDETFLFSFGTKGGTPRTLSNPRGLAIDENRRIIFVVDYMRHAILAYNQDDGEFLFEFGGKGKGLGWFNYPTGIAVNQKGQVIVADLFNHRAQVIDVKYQPETVISDKPQSSGASVDSESAVAPEKAGEPKETGEASPLIETHGVIGEEAIQDGEPAEKPAANAGPGQSGADEEKNPVGE